MNKSFLLKSYRRNRLTTEDIPLVKLIIVLLLSIIFSVFFIRLFFDSIESITSCCFSKLGIGILIYIKVDI